MASKQSNVRKLKPQPKPQLTNDELQRIAEKLATALEHNAEEIALLTLLFDHLENGGNLLDTTFTVKKYIWIGTTDADHAHDKFRSDAYTNRGKLLRWPNERGDK